MIIRQAEIADAESLASIIRQIDASSEYMLWEAGEREIQAESQRKIIENLKRTGNSAVFVAEKDNELVGYLLAIGGNAKRNKHSAYVVIGISENYRGQGIGTQLFNGLDHWAANNKISRLELTVVTKNVEGLSLYRKAGFEVEGTKRNSLFIDGTYVDEYYMSKILV